MTPEERAETLIRRLGQNPALVQPVADAIRAAVEAEREAKSAELEAARAVIAAMRHSSFDWADLEAALDDYDAAVKASRS